MTSLPRDYGHGFGAPRPSFNFRILISLGLRVLVGVLLCYYVWLFTQVPSQDEVDHARVIAMKELSHASAGLDPSDFEWAYRRENGTWTFFTVKDHRVYYYRDGEGKTISLRRDAAYTVTVDSNGAAHVTQNFQGKVATPASGTYLGEGRDDGP